MANSDLSVDPTTLLAHTDWMRGLAQHLVHDEHVADDIAQEAASIALQAGESARAAKPWLQTVVRNLARRSFRDRSRRSRRERVAARPESLSVDDTVERAELHSQLTSWVLELDDPYRSALLLRFFDDSSPKEIAERLGVPSSTVRVWLSRGLARIRTRLDEQHGDRPAWSLLLVNAFGLERNTVTSVAASAASTGAVSWWSLGGWIMTVKNWSVVAPLVLLLIGGGVVLKMATGQNPNEDPTVASRVEEPKTETADAGSPGLDVPTPTADSSSAAASSTLARVTGRVVDTNDDPVANVTLRIVDVSSDEDVAHLESEADGSFQFSTAPGVVDVLTDDDRWTTTEFRRIRVDNDRDDLIIRVAEAATLCGWVSDQGTQARIAGARVRAVYVGRVLREVISDDEGRFCLSGLMVAPSDVKIIAHAEGYVRQASVYQPSVQLEAGETREEYRLALEAGVPITGRVIDGNGNGIAGASVYYRGRLGALTQDVRTDQNGQFRFSLPVGPTYSFWAETEDRGTTPILGVDLTANGFSIGDWVARAGATIEGRLVNEVGDPLADCLLSATPRGTGSRRTATSDADGRFLLSNLLPGEHRIAATVSGTPLWAESSSKLIFTHEEHVTGVELRVNVGWEDRISGRVSWANGDPAPRQSVQVRRGQDITFTHTDDEGGFTAVGLTAADYEVTVGSETRVVSTGTTGLDWKIHSPREQDVTIRVVNSKNGQPVEYFSYTVNQGRATSSSPPRNHKDGVLSLERASNQLLVVKVGALELGEGELRIEPTATTAPLELELLVHSTPMIKGRVVTDDGAPVPGAVIRKFADERSQILARTRVDGSFECNLGEINTLYARHPDFSLGRIEVSTDQELEIVMSPLSRVTGRVVQGNHPFVGPIKARFGEQTFKTRSDADGNFELRVPPSEAIVVFEVATDHETVEIQKVLDFDQRRHFKVRLPRLDARLEGKVLNAPETTGSLEFVVQAAGGFTVQERWPLEKDGTFTFADLPAGELTVRVLDQGMPTGQSQFFTLTAGTNSIQVDLAPAQGSFTGRVEGRADHESLMLILWTGQIEIDLETLTMADVARLQASASRAERLDTEESFEVEGLEPGLYTYWLLAADPKNPPKSIADFRTKVRSKVGTVTLPQTEGELRITLPAAQ